MSHTPILWIEQLELLIQNKHMLSSPFYQAWSCGKLSKKQLQDYALEYYHHVKAFPTYISALHSRCEDPTIRKSLLSNLIDEEGGEPNHPDLWKSFVLALGVSQEEINIHTPHEQTKSLINTFRESCSTPYSAMGVAALYCYESQIPAICKTKIDGLKQWYGITAPEDYRYFSVHETADVEHSQVEKEILMALVKPEEEKAVLKGAEKILEALERFLGSFLN